MKFEVFDQNGKRLFWTESEDCVPDKEDLKLMAKVSGYKFRMNGKVYKP